jgi:YidC/Oxa1 family membrane protein insertase
MDKMDIKRTVLWVIFAMSLLMLWDKWMIHSGKPSLFFPATTAQQAKNASAAGTASVSASTSASATAGVIQWTRQVHRLLRRSKAKPSRLRLI